MAGDYQGNNALETGPTDRVLQRRPSRREGLHTTIESDASGAGGA